MRDTGESTSVALRARPGQRTRASPSTWSRVGTAPRGRGVALMASHRRRRRRTAEVGRAGCARSSPTGATSDPDAKSPMISALDLRSASRGAGVSPATGLTMIVPRGVGVALITGQCPRGRARLVPAPADSGDKARVEAPKSPTAARCLSRARKAPRGCHLRVSRISFFLFS